MDKDNIKDPAAAALPDYVPLPENLPTSWTPPTASRPPCACARHGVGPATGPDTESDAAHR